ncbi:bifunctional 4-hydroxy-2-oxoglutarate aldolase/2-dehydro-3-deoxy-phosphogluconate aldolase [Deminuibacter soli]|uniref:Bifunctional 4-hydroxy-2-oxoglutarate aldolase/2-dehydro-3-deoxy-phosphogluconate aldolase n=1 Tax=Deminuibacter soli TaxID=2291815 RepID=A0A3E1NL32_9BACT|nr:bifunctional 4-hydroxy-2-oxoglutarate aldolase/2-dehydro-3-deoxy-phosphogluconate aldolase [Deminuibacter soli]RFM28601.1 bifunctional 4-hydroxy-2-oxoglutarate aldolase/2-dehydro-3-deoxy-phosphogluconate aldolase [Deminuibacter soli]
MNKYDSALHEILDKGILPLYFHADIDICINILKALYQAGIRAVEFTNRGEAALRNFSSMKAVRDAEMKDLQLGVGTIKNEHDAKAFVAAGADFLVSPGYVPEVNTVAQDNGLLWIPGCMTPSEIIQAENAGVKFVKLFPGNLLMPSFLEAIRPIFPDLLFMPTGGVEVEKTNIQSWFKAGVSAVGLGSKLINKAILDQDDYAHFISALTEKAICLVKTVRQ